MLRIHDRLTLTIDQIAFGGDGIGRVEGQVVFVPFSAAGDVVEVEIIKTQKGFARGSIVRPIELSPGREKPLCPYFQKCGGCQYQHLQYSEELRWKEKQITENLQRLGSLANIPVSSIIPSPEPYGYRNRITVHSEKGKIGFRGVDPNQLIDIESCAIAMPEVNAELQRLRQRREVEGHFSLRHPDLPPSAFFQTNHALLQTLQDLVASGLSGKNSFLLEGYCGGGFFTQKLAAHFEKIIAIEQDARSLRDAARLSLPSVEWHEGDVTEILPRLLPTFPQEKTAVLLDPPREGLPPTVVEALLTYPVAEMVYVSCNPAALARDAKKLSTSYLLNRVQPIDLFPRTAQVECVTFWQKRS